MLSRHKAQQPSWALGRLSVEVCISHTIRHTTPGRTPPNEWSARRKDRYLHNTQTQDTNIHALIGIRTRDPSNRPVANLRLRPQDHWDHNRLTLKKFDGVQKQCKTGWGGWGTISVNPFSDDGASHKEGLYPTPTSAVDLPSRDARPLGNCTVSVTPPSAAQFA